jgi:serine/threonine protein kinase/formylglycine-generating enzyme required for sulfatase activity
MTPQREWQPPPEFDEYRIVHPLGSGGMGRVYLAYDGLLDRMVAIKFIAEVEPNSDARERFLIEARAAARLQHPNVAAVYRVGELDGHPYIITEFIRGASLDTLDLPVPWRRVLELGVSLARGLAAAHRHGVLHRDIKPGNAILADDGEVKLVDFGLAKLTDDYVPNSTSPPQASRSPRSRISRNAATIDAGGGGLEALSPDPSARRLDDTPPPSSIRPPSSLVPISHTLQSIDAPPPNGAAHSTKASDSSESLSLTKAGDLMGTPYYMAPEVWRGEPATRRSDVFALGIVLYELCAGFPPHRDVRLRELRRVRVEQDSPPLADVAPQVDPRFAAVVDRCLSRDPARRFGSGDELRDALEQLVPHASGAAIPEGNPYRGLQSFEAEHRALFFGRTHEVRAVVERLRSEPFVLVAGDSGTGKSSLCRAGVLPLVEEGELQEGRTWSVVRLVPGRRPVAGLAAALASFLNRDDEEATAESIAAEPEQLCRDLRRRLGGKLGLVIFVDQLEELLTLSSREEAETTAAFFARIAVGLPGVRLLATVRGDFLTRLTRLPGFQGDLTRALYLLRPMSPDRIREAIVGPAHATGVRFETDALVDTLVASTARTDGALPLLQFALAELWEARERLNKVIPGSALDAVGGVAGALARHADAVLASLLPRERAAARRILMRLVTAEGTRARRTEEELIGSDPAAKAALEALVRGRLLAAREVEGGTSYEVAHEALLHGWATLRDWLDAQAETRAVRQRLEAAAAEWERLGRTREVLWSARQLAEAAPIAVEELHPREVAFLGSSRRSVRTKRIVRNATIVAIPALLGLVYGVVSLQARREIDRQVAAHLADATTEIADARERNKEVEALRTEAFAHFDAGRRKEAEEAWARVLAAQSVTARAYTRASQALETALGLDGTRRDIRNTLGDILYERVLLAERDHHEAQLDELQQRVSLYDEGGERRARLNAPATITVTPSPVPARIVIERYVDEGKRFRSELVREIEETSSAELELPPGSYVLTFRAPQRSEVRYPVYLRRGETLTLPIELPEAGKIPPGFVYIPEGRHFFGTTSEEPIRLFLDNAPVHELRSGSFLVAEKETTYAQWIEYLSALTPAERAAYRQDFSHYRGSSRLSELPDGKWQITLQPSGQLYTAASGEMLTYATRTTRKSQNWLNFPVAGIAVQDVEAYTAWLRSSGRVPGARLCSEVEWERAARGADQREYPHGDRLSPEDANFDLTYGRQPGGFGPDVVGSYPMSRSPFGLYDMSGNVWEWTRSVLTPGAYVVRGGSFYQGSTVNRSTNRESVDSTLRDLTLGVRICATYPLR